MATTSVELDAETYRAIALAAKVSRKSVAQVIALAIEAYIRTDNEVAQPARPPSASEVPIFCHYRDNFVEGIFDRRTGRVVITKGAALEGKRYRSLSAAGVGVIRAFNQDRLNVSVNGWRFWRLQSTGDYVDTLR